MKFKIDPDSLCARCYPSAAEIKEYLEETNLIKRLDLAYDYRITDEHLFPEDLRLILDDYYNALNEAL